MNGSYESRLDAESKGDSSSRRWLARAETVVVHPVFAYAAILVLQLRVVWNIWKYKDTSSGDTSYYFLEGLKWAQHLQDDIVLSPLYTNYFGTVVRLVPDVVSAVMVHRILVVFAAALLVLAVMRALLGPGLGLLVAAWWAVVPANFNVDYEVHLFGFIPVLVGALLVARSPSRSARGAALGLLLCTALLMRNEFIIAAIVFAIGIVIAEVRQRRAQHVPLRAYVRSYGIPIVIVLGLTAGAYLQSPDHGRHASAEFRAKHGLNMCQIYAFNYQQRYPSKFTGNPFTQCAPLMQRVFGRPAPSFAQELETNPHAVAGFVAWNAHLMPTGLQVALFGATSTGLNPGYFPVELHRRYALALSFALLLLIAAGLTVIIRAPTYRWAQMQRQRWALLYFAAIAITAVYAAFTQRPRAEYIYGLTIGLMALTIVCVGALLWRIVGARLIPAFAAFVTLLLIVAVPSYYRPAPRPLHDALERVKVVRSDLQRPGAVLVTSGYNFEICAYTARSFDQHCTSPSWNDLHSQLLSGKPIDRVLDDAHATVIYDDPILGADPSFAHFVGSRRASNWRVVSSGTGTDGHWTVLVRR